MINMSGCDLLISTHSYTHAMGGIIAMLVVLYTVQVDVARRRGAVAQRQTLWGVGTYPKRVVANELRHL